VTFVRFRYVIHNLVDSLLYIKIYVHLFQRIKKHIIAIVFLFRLKKVLQHIIHQYNIKIGGILDELPITKS